MHLFELINGVVLDSIAQLAIMGMAMKAQTDATAYVPRTGFCSSPQGARWCGDEWGSNDEVCYRAELLRSAFGVGVRAAHACIGCA